MASDNIKQDSETFGSSSCKIDAHYYFTSADMLSNLQTSCAEDKLKLFPPAKGYHSTHTFLDDNHYRKLWPSTTWSNSTHIDYLDDKQYTQPLSLKGSRTTKTNHINDGHCDLWSSLKESHSTVSDHHDQSRTKHQTISCNKLINNSFFLNTFGNENSFGTDATENVFQYNELTSGEYTSRYNSCINIEPNMNMEPAGFQKIVLNNVEDVNPFMMMKKDDFLHYKNTMPAPEFTTSNETDVGKMQLHKMIFNNEPSNSFTKTDVSTGQFNTRYFNEFYQNRVQLQSLVSNNDTVNSCLTTKRDYCQYRDILNPVHRGPQNINAIDDDIIEFLKSLSRDFGGDPKSANKECENRGNECDIKPIKSAKSYIALISMAILSSINKKMLLGDIYKYFLHTYHLMDPKIQSWKNSIRHNLSVNECFIKVGKNEIVKKAKSNFWSIHPACMEAFSRGDFRRRLATRRIRERSVSLLH